MYLSWFNHSEVDIRSLHSSSAHLLRLPATAFVRPVVQKLHVCLCSRGTSQEDTGRLSQARAGSRGHCQADLWRRLQGHPRVSRLCVDFRVPPHAAPSLAATALLTRRPTIPPLLLTPTLPDYSLLLCSVHERRDGADGGVRRRTAALAVRRHLHPRVQHYAHQHAATQEAHRIER